MAVAGAFEQLHGGRFVADLLLVLRAQCDDLVPPGQQQAEDAFPLGRVLGVLGVKVGPGVVAGVGDGGRRLARGADGSHHSHREHSEDDAEGEPGADLDHEDGLAVVDVIWLLSSSCTGWGPERGNPYGLRLRGRDC